MPRLLRLIMSVAVIFSAFAFTAAAQVEESYVPPPSEGSGTVDAEAVLPVAGDTEFGAGGCKDGKAFTEISHRPDVCPLIKNKGDCLNKSYGVVLLTCMCDSGCKEAPNKPKQPDEHCMWSLGKCQVEHTSAVACPCEKK